MRAARAYQCGPAERQPLEKSANSWMWNPCLPGVMPEIFHEMTHGASADACEKVTMPVHGVALSAPPWHGLPAGETEQVAWIGKELMIDRRESENPSESRERGI